MKKQFQILAATLVSVVVISYSTQGIKMPATAHKDSNDMEIQELTNKVDATSETANWVSTSVITTPVNLNRNRIELTYEGDEIRIYKNGVYLNSIY